MVTLDERVIKMFHIPDTIRTAVGDFRAHSQKIGYQVSQYIPEPWRESGGKGVTVAVLDTGCQVDHVDFVGSVDPDGGYYNAITAETRKELHRQWKKTGSKRLKARVENLAEVTDRDGHGTHVSGIISANSNTTGVLGVAPEAIVYPIKVLGDDGTGKFEWIIDGIYKSIRAKVDVINMSLGSTVGNRHLKKAIQSAYDKGIPVVCAAGNAGTNRLDYPALYKESISVGAIDKSDSRARFSQMGSNLDFVAPGVEILSTVPTNRYMIMSGTSMAAPWLSGVIALVLSKHRKHGGKTPINNVEDVRNHLKKICIDLGDVGRDPKTGFGIVDLSKLKEHFKENL